MGVDLGTTFSLAAKVNEQGMPTLFPDLHDSSAFRTPSVVHVGEPCLVGQAVEDLLDEDPGLAVVRFVKARMGSEEAAVNDARGRAWSPAAVSALILRKLRRDAETFENDEIGGAVVAVPAQFGDAQRRATKEAALLADLPLLTLVEEPVAAATYYGLKESRSEQTLFVYDLGGGTFDATVLQVSPDGLYVLATDGSAKVGGVRFDEILMDVIAAEFRRAHRVDPLADPRAAVQLRRLAEQVKIKIGKPGVGQVRQAALLCGKMHEFVITRSQFESLVQPLVAETMAVCERCLAGASLSWGLVDKVLLTGGSTLVPAVQNRVLAESGRGREKMAVQQPHQAVGFGAALVATQAAGAGEKGGAPPLLQAIASYDLGMSVRDPRTGKPAIEVLVKRNTPLPAKHTSTFYTTRADQKRLIFQLVQAKADEPPLSLGDFAFGPIPAPRKNYPVEVTIAYDVEGIVRVTARDPETGRAMEQVMENESQVEESRLRRERAMVREARINE